MNRLRLYESGIALLAGGLATLALAPVHFFAILPITFSALLLLVLRARCALHAFGFGWLFGFGYFLTGLHWIAEAFTVASWTPSWLGIIAVTMLAGSMAVFPGAAAWLVHRLRPPPWAAPVVLAAAWTAMAWLRGNVLTGFPWNLIGYAWADSIQLIQSAAWIGAYGLTFVTVLGSATLALLWPAVLCRAPRLPLIMFVLVVIASGVLWLYGDQRLSTATLSSYPNVTLRLVQGNITQTMKRRPELREAIVERYSQLTRQPGFDQVTHIIWPEAALPYVVDPATSTVVVGQSVPVDGLLLTGAITQRTTPGGVVFANSLVAFNQAGILREYYDKAHLVPFGEYMPLPDWLGVRKLAGGPEDLTPGRPRAPLQLPGLPGLRALICYEAIFPSIESEPDNMHETNWREASWLLNISNDAWFGSGPGPYQHFAMARMRAVEQGITLVRVANTGISAVVDPYGRVVKTLGMDQAGVLDSGLYRPLDAHTLYSEFGDIPVLLICLFVLAFCLIERQMQATDSLLP